MTALVFPPAPAIDEQFPDPSIPGVPVWFWDGIKWVMRGAGPPAPPTQTALVYISESPPDGVAEGSLWYDPTNNSFSILHETLWQPIASRTTTIVAANLRGYIDGLHFLWLGAQDTFRVTNGTCNADDHSGMIALANSDVSAAAIFGAGGNLDMGAVAAGWYHVFAIDKETFDAPDILISASANAPTMPPDYVKKRRIFSYRAGASPFYPEHIEQDGDLFLWDAQRNEGTVTVNNNNPNFWTLANVPPGISVEALLTLQYLWSGGTVYTDPLYVTSALIPGTYRSAVPQTFTFVFNSAAGNRIHVQNMRFVTNANRQIRYQTSNWGSQTLNLSIGTNGWIDLRGKNEIIRPVVGSRQRIFNFTWSGTPTVNVIGRTWRVVIPAAQLVQAPGDRIQIEFLFPVNWANGIMQAAWVGHRATSGQPYHFDGGQVRLQFGGSNSTSITGVTTLLSDEALFTYDKDRDLIVSFYCTGSRQGSRAGSPNVIGSYQGAVGTDNSGTTAPTLTLYSYVCINVAAGYVRQP